MDTERRLVGAALRDAIRMGRWRVLGRRARFAKLYFQLRAEGVGWRRARTLVRRTRTAVRGLRQEPVALDVALDLVLA